MRNNVMIASIAVLLVVVAAVMFWPSKESPTASPVSLTRQAQAPAVNSSRTNTVETKADDLAEDESSDEVNPYADEQIKAQLMQVADLYAQTSKYPHTSQPILNPAAVAAPEPFTETEVDTPFPGDGDLEPLRLVAATDKFQYFAGEPIRARVSIVGAPQDTFIAAKAWLATAREDTPLASDLTPADVSGNEYFATFDTRLLPTNLAAREMLMKVQVEVGEDNYFTTVGFRYDQADATLVAIPYVRQDGPHLNIALQYDVARAGYYLSTAILADAASGRPLVRLQAEGSMNQGNGLQTMQAHIAALKVGGSEGPYLLQRVNGYRASEPGESFNVPVATSQAEYQIQGYPFDQYEDVPYTDPYAEERQNFLEDIGSIDNPNP